MRLATEDYFFVCRKQTLDNPSVQRMLEIMRGDEFRDSVAKLPGYTPRDAGLVKPIMEALRG